MLAMMIIVANLRVSGFFSIAGSRILQVAHSPRALLGVVVLVSGILSALFLNDTICLMFTPLVAELTRRTRRDGRPYLIALPISANAGSCATSIGNPQKRTSTAALVAATILLVTRRVNPEHVFAEVDFTLLVFFSGLFVLTAEVANTPAFADAMEAIGPSIQKPGALFAAAVAFISNLVSNVPAVMLLSPAARAMQNPKPAWLMLAMASTFAGNLTILGSVANLIVAEQGKKAGIHIGFVDYLKVGLPVTILSLAAGVIWLVLLF